MKRNDKHPAYGTTMEEILREDGVFEDLYNQAVKDVLVWQLEQQRKELRLSKTALAKRMDTSRAALDRLLDPNNSSVTLHTLTKAAEAVGKKLKIDLVDTL